MSETDDRLRRGAAAACWVLAGGCFALVSFVPWAVSGPLSRSSLVDLAGLVRSGVLTTLPGWVPGIAAVMPLLGAAIVALAVPAAARWIRPVLLVAAGLLWWGLTREVTGADVGRWSYGPWLGMSGVVLGAAAFWVEPRRRRQS